MGEPPCDLIEAELGLDRLEAELAAELPGHIRAFAEAHARSSRRPPAPVAMRRTSSLVTARRALPHPLLADRALVLLRLIVPIAIEDDPAVAKARLPPREPDPEWGFREKMTWDAFAALAAARDAVALRRFDLPHVELLHALHGVEPGSDPAVHVHWPGSVGGWTTRGTIVAPAAIEEVWRLIAERHGVRGTVQIARSVHFDPPRAFVIEPGVAASVVLPTHVTSLADRFATLHELGHALAALIAPGGIPRAVDEAVAAYIGRLMELPGELPAGWYSPLADPARHRRTSLARSLDAVERGAVRDPAIEVPQALWNDPAAQAAYVAAEAIAERWWNDELGPTPGPGALAQAIADERSRVDRTFHLR